MSTCADDMVKFGTAMSTTEPTLGEEKVGGGGGGGGKGEGGGGLSRQAVPMFLRVCMYHVISFPLASD